VPRGVPTGMYVAIFRRPYPLHLQCKVLRNVGKSLPVYGVSCTSTPNSSAATMSQSNIRIHLVWCGVLWVSVFKLLFVIKPIVTARSKAWVCSRSYDGNAGSNPAGDMNICLLRVLCVARYRSIQWTDPSTKRSLLRVCLPLSVIKYNNKALHVHWIRRRSQTKKGKGWVKLINTLIWNMELLFGKLVLKQ
jgi:hypothetical protein